MSTFFRSLIYDLIWGGGTLTVFSKHLIQRAVPRGQSPNYLYFEISFLCIFPFHYVSWSYLLGKFNSQQKKIFTVHKNIIRWRECLVARNCLINVVYFTFMWPSIVTNFFVIKPNRCTNFTNLFWHETLRVSDSSSGHHQEFIHRTLSNGICHTAFEQEQDGTAVPSWSYSKAVYKPVWHILVRGLEL